MVKEYVNCVTEVQEVSCSVCLVLEVKGGLNNGADGRVQGRGAQMTVPTSPSSVITAAQSTYPTSFHPYGLCSFSHEEHRHMLKFLLVS
jgi:hypothetical protein